MGQFVNTTLGGGIGRLTFNRPDKRNALSRDFLDEINAGIDQLAGDDSLRVLVIAAEGSVFCAGMDLGQMQERAQSADGKADWQRDSEVYCDLMTKIYSLDVPTIAMVQGPALAGGVGIVLACDIVVASDNAFFMLPEPVRGITAAMVTPLLIHRVGGGPATYLLLSGERVAATQAAAFGMCHSVVAREDLQARIDALLNSILAGSKSALAITKRHIRRCLSADVLEDLRMSVSISAEARETDDAREGLAAFLEKRKPNWQTQE
jgi:methylglutaconyl-CoA hydratase